MTDPLRELEPPNDVAWPGILNDPSGWSVSKAEALSRIEAGITQILETVEADRETAQAGHLRLAAAHVRAAGGYYEPIVDCGGLDAF